MTNNEYEKIIVYADPEIEYLIPGFLDNRKHDVPFILESLKKKDFEMIQLVGHSMKGAGVGYGFSTISKIGGYIERAANNREQHEIKQYVKDLSRYLDSVQVVYE